MLGRSYKLKVWASKDEVDFDAENLERLAGYKFNKAYLSYGKLSDNWYILDDVYKYAFKELGKASGDLVDLIVMINPYKHLGYEPLVDDISPDLIDIFTHNDPEDMDKILNGRAQMLSLLDQIDRYDVKFTENLDETEEQIQERVDEEWQNHAA